jgi:hypothetical protein
MILSREQREQNVRSDFGGLFSHHFLRQTRFLRPLTEKPAIVDVSFLIEAFNETTAIEACLAQKTVESDYKNDLCGTEVRTIPDGPDGTNACTKD